MFDPEVVHQYGTVWISNYDTFAAYGMATHIALAGEYSNDGLSAAEALDLVSVIGMGYRDKFGWSNLRNLGCEAIRKNVLNGKDKLLDSGWSGSHFNIKQTNRCRDCGRNMHEAESCDKKRVGTLVDNEGKSFDRNRFEDRVRENVVTVGLKQAVFIIKDATEKGCDEQLLSCDCQWISYYPKNQTIDLTKRYLL